MTAGVILLAESDANMQSTTCRADLGEEMDGLPARAMTVWVGHAPNGATIVTRRLSRIETASSCDRGRADIRLGEIVPLEQQRCPPVPRDGIGEAVPQVQLRGMTGALAIPGEGVSNAVSTSSAVMGTGANQSCAIEYTPHRHCRYD